MNQEGLLHNYVKKLRRVKEEKVVFDEEGAIGDRKFCMVCGSNEKLHSLSRSIEIVEIICSECLPFLPSKDEIEKVSPGIFTRPPKDIEV
jgi:hypothetical protein